jgi:hypothetical protein
MLPDPNYLVEKNDDFWEERAELVELLVEIHYKLKLLPETLFLAINVIDRFCRSNLYRSMNLNYN